MTKRERLECLRPVFDCIASNSINGPSPLYGSIVGLLKALDVDLQKLASMAVHTGFKHTPVEAVWFDFMRSWLMPNPGYPDEYIAKDRNDWLDRVEQAMSD